MSVRFFYIDESFDASKFCLSAIAIRHTEWRECFDRVREHREFLKKDHGIFLRKEIHAQEFVGGRGRIADRIIGKHARSRIFEGLLNLVAQLPNVIIMNICLDVPGRKDVQLDAWDRLMNRIERALRGFEETELPLRRELISALPPEYPDAERERLDYRVNLFAPRGVIVADQGREREITRALRKMGVYNPIPSRIGAWGDGSRTKNVPVQRIIEDPVFKLSHQSYFIQLADAVAYSLLKRETTPTPNVRRYGIDKMFERTLAGVCWKKASSSDPLGIVRK
ncbi:MAG TPA: DUF3800 domain-containing protein [Thermoanaerobaculia bacterium]|jgi:hypothetical protein